MIGLVLTLDYELFGTGAGEFETHVIAPTARLLNIASESGARITIMAEVAEILALRREPDFFSTASRIESQLQAAISAGHDVQLHLHPAWFKAQYSSGAWKLAFDEYGLPGLPADLVRDYIFSGKTYLDALGKQVRPEYECIAFRAGGWLVQPSAAIIAGLTAAGILVDSSVFKGGFGHVGHYSLDFRAAPSEVFSWLADPADLSRSHSSGSLREIPIFSRRVPLWSMATPRRLQLQRRLLKQSAQAHFPDSRLARGRRASRLRLTYPKKFDYCRSTFTELKSFVHLACNLCRENTAPVPVVAIGHSTEFTDDGTLRRFLDYLARERREDVTYMTFQECAQ